VRPPAANICGQSFLRAIHSKGFGSPVPSFRSKAGFDIEANLARFEALFLRCSKSSHGSEIYVAGANVGKAPIELLSQGGYIPSSIRFKRRLNPYRIHVRVSYAA
jgi:hypothetical protein